jgi:hypothetical protein
LLKPAPSQCSVQANAISLFHHLGPKRKYYISTVTQKEEQQHFIMAAKSDFQQQGILTTEKQNWLHITKTCTFVNWNKKIQQTYFMMTFAVFTFHLILLGFLNHNNTYTMLGKNKRDRFCQQANRRTET